MSQSQPPGCPTERLGQPPALARAGPSGTPDSSRFLSPLPSQSNDLVLWQPACQLRFGYPRSQKRKKKLSAAPYEAMTSFIHSRNKSLLNQLLITAASVTLRVFTADIPEAAARPRAIPSVQPVCAVPTGVCRLLEPCGCPRLFRGSVRVLLPVEPGGAEPGPCTPQILAMGRLTAEARAALSFLPAALGTIQGAFGF